jgi:hypothetical protein
MHRYLYIEMLSEIYNWNDECVVNASTKLNLTHINCSECVESCIHRKIV